MTQLRVTAEASVLVTHALTETGELPLVVSPAGGAATLEAAAAEIHALAEQRLPLAGGLLFRGFDVGGLDGFRAFAAGFGHPLSSYEFGSTPRSRLSEGVYSSTEYPSHQVIPLHNEQAYSRSWPMKIWFYCVVASPVGGETPIADSRQVYARLPVALRERFAERRLMYVRNYGGGLDVDWPDVFNTRDRAQVERYCREHGIGCEWKAGGELRTRQVCQAVAQHPRTRESVWFNQAHLFHVSALPADVREALLEVVEPEELPRNVYYGDGAPIEPSALDEVRGVLESCKVTFTWQPGDVLMLDNMLAAHGRNPFTGARKIVVAMAEARTE